MVVVFIIFVMAEQCAIGSDGQLLEADKIPWFNDPDDELPLPSPPAASTSTRRIPVTIVAGYRRTGRISHPSRCLVDPDNAEATSSTRKRKVSATNAELGLPLRKVSRLSLASIASHFLRRHDLPAPSS